VLEVACITISPLLTNETCDPVIGGHMPVPVQCWLAYRTNANSVDKSRPVLRVIVSHATREQTCRSHAVIGYRL